MEVKETLKSKERYRWYTEIQRMKRKGWNVKDACRELRISRSEYYYWDRKVRQYIDATTPGSFRITTHMFKSLSKAPHYSSKKIPDQIVDLIVRIRKKSNKGAEWIQYDLKVKYQIHVSITGIYKTLKREGLITERK